MSKPNAPSLSARSLRQLSTLQLLQHPPALPIATAGGMARHSPSDFDLNPDAHNDWQPPPSTRQAAVLVPIIARPALTVLFTQRPQHLTVHAGQISFPGGKSEPHDASLQETAFREAKEEVGLIRDHIEPLGYLDAYLTGTGFSIAPLVALIDPSFQPRPDANEVEEVFEVPLDFLMQSENHQKHTRQINGRTRSFYAMPYQQRFIWGATAGILKNMHTRFYRQ
jgi:8-oxo-dGTP pyrophosphatase MutT (NUDIX family)